MNLPTEADPELVNIMEPGRAPRHDAPKPTVQLADTTSTLEKVRAVVKAMRDLVS